MLSNDITISTLLYCHYYFSAILMLLLYLRYSNAITISSYSYYIPIVWSTGLRDRKGIYTASADWQRLHLLTRFCNLGQGLVMACGGADSVREVKFESVYSTISRSWWSISRRDYPITVSDHLPVGPVQSNQTCRGTFQTFYCQS